MNHHFILAIALNPSLSLKCKMYMETVLHCPAVYFKILNQNEGQQTRGHINKNCVSYQTNLCYPSVLQQLLLSRNDSSKSDKVFSSNEYSFLNSSNALLEKNFNSALCFEPLVSQSRQLYISICFCIPVLNYNNKSKVFKAKRNFDCIFKVTSSNLDFIL